MIPSIAETTTDRALINRANAQRSTGPKTEEGKQRSSLNALRHGLTGQTIILNLNAEPDPSRTLSPSSAPSILTPEP